MGQVLLRQRQVSALGRVAGPCDRGAVGGIRLGPAAQPPQQVGAARRLKVHAKARDVRGVDRVVIRDGEAIATMLTRLGAHQAVLAWE